MIISRRLLSWGARACKVRASKGGKGGKDSGSGGREWRSELHAHADWLDRALYNGVLGTQRGTQGARPSERVFEHSLIDHPSKRTHQYIDDTDAAFFNEWAEVREGDAVVGRCP